MWQIIGQNRALSLLQRSLGAGTLAHAYLLVGPAHVGKMTLALNLAQALNCEAAEHPCLECPSCLKIASGGHADVSVIGLERDEDAAEAKLIHIEQIKELQHSASLPPFEGRSKVFIIDGAELLSIDAANCLLKTLEEPPEKLVFVLLTTSERLLSSTVVSRCQRIEMPPLTVNEVELALTERGIESERAGLLARLSHGCLGWAITAAGDDAWLTRRDEELERMLGTIDGGYDERFDYATRLAAHFGQSRRLVYYVLDFWLDYWRDLMLVKTGCVDMITNVDRESGLAAMASRYRLVQIKDYIESILRAAAQLRQNVNPRLALEVLMLDIPVKEGGNGAKQSVWMPVRNG